MRRFDPFRELERLFDDDWFGMFAPVRMRGPAVNVSQTDKDVVVEFELPSIDPKKVEITIEDQSMTISGGEEEERKEEGKNFFRREIRYGKFSRTVALPVAVKGDQARAEYKDGVLKVTVPKAESTPRKKVQVEIK